MDVINNFLDVKDLIDDLYPKASLNERALIITKFMIMKPMIKEIIDFNFTLLTHLQNLLESKRSFADQYIILRISVLALLISILALLIAII